MRLDERARRASEGIRSAVAQAQAPARSQRETHVLDRGSGRGRLRLTVPAVALATAAVIVAVAAVGRSLPRARHDHGITPVSTQGLILYGQWDARAQAANWYTIHADGTDETNLHVRATCATWFPDGSKILITDDAAVDAAHPLRPATINPDGTGLHPLDGAADPNLNLGCGDVSPDGSTIAVEGFNDNRKSVNGVYIISASAGGHLRRITHSPTGGADGDPRFAPDGRHIVFLRNKPGIGTEGAGALFVASTTGTAPRRITPWGYAFLGYDWSPDGDWIVFQHPYGELYLVHPDGSGLHRIPLPLPPGAGAQNPAWSPDSRSIVFSVRQDGRANLYVANLDGTGVTQLTPGSGTEAQTPDWAP